MSEYGHTMGLLGNLFPPQDYNRERSFQQQHPNLLAWLFADTSNLYELDNWFRIIQFHTCITSSFKLNFAH